MPRSSTVPIFTASTAGKSAQPSVASRRNDGAKLAARSPPASVFRFDLQRPRIPNLRGPMKIPLLLPFFAAALLSAQPPSPLPLAKPEDVGLSTERLQRVDTFVERLQAEHQISGAVAIVARRGKLVLLRAHGYGDLSGRRLLRPDDIFALASMTKPVVAAAVLTLLEEDKLLLGDPVEKYLPEFRGARVAVPRPDAAGGYDLVALKRSITIHDLLIHRSGLATGAGPAAAELRAAMRGLPADRAPRGPRQGAGRRAAQLSARSRLGIWPVVRCARPRDRGRLRPAARCLPAAAHLRAAPDGRHRIHRAARKIAALGAHL